MGIENPITTLQVTGLASRPETGVYRVGRWRHVGVIVCIVTALVWLCSANRMLVVAAVTRHLELPGLPVGSVSLELVSRRSTAVSPSGDSRWSAMWADGTAVTVYDGTSKRLVRIDLSGGEPVAVGDECADPPLDLVEDASGELVAVHGIPPRAYKLSEPLLPAFGDWQDFVVVMSMATDAQGRGYVNAVRKQTRNRGEVVVLNRRGEIIGSWGRQMLGRLCLSVDGAVYVLNLAHFEPESRRQFLAKFTPDGRRLFMRRLAAEHQASTIVPAPDGGLLVFSRAGRYVSHVDPRGNSVQLLLSWQQVRPALIASWGELVYVVCADGTLETYRFTVAGER